MAGYVVRRTLESIPLLLVIAFVSFMLVHLAPGGPGATLMQPGVSVAALHAYRASLGLNQPLYVQFFDWLAQLAQGNFGYSYGSGEPVLREIMGRLPNTVILMGSAVALQVVIAIPFGIVAAVRQYSFIDYATTVLAFIGISIPDYWLGFMLIYVFAVQMPIFPAGGMVTLGQPFSAGDLLRHLVLPAVTLATVGIAGITRYLRSSMLEVLSQDYIRTARAKGLGERVVHYKHALRNALIPVVTILGLQVLPTLFAGAVIAETVFNWPGMGQLFYTALNERNYPVALGVTIIAATLVVFGNVAADVTYAFIDPRIQYT